MTDPREILRDARARMRPLVARLMARRDEARAALDASTDERARLATEAEEMRAGGRSDLADAVTEGLAELDLRIQAEREALSLAEQHFHAAVEDMQALAKDEGQVDHAQLRAAIAAAMAPAGDDLSLSPADIALRNVRDHAAELEGVSALNESLAKPAPAPADAEAKARAQLAEMKAARSGKKKPTL